MEPTRPTRARRLARVPWLGPWVVGLHRLGIAARAARRSLRAVARWWWHSREVTNFTYALSPRNEEQLAAFLAAVTGAELERVFALMDELAGDTALRDGLRAATVSGPDACTSDAEPRYGRRIGWYVLVRLLRPRVVVESGVDKGLGACVLATALARNAAEGHPGLYTGIDPNPAAGRLFADALAPDVRGRGRILRGDSLERLREIEGIDLFVHDSDHSAGHEDAEYALLEERLSEHAVVLSDNAHVTDCLLRFARRTKRRYLFFAERPRDHWHPGAGIGAAFR